MTQTLQLPADPSRLRPRFQRNPPWLTAEMLRERTCLVTETAFFHDLPFSVHNAVAAHLVAQVNADGLLRYLLPRFAKLLHGWLLLCTSTSAFHSLSLSKAGQPSHPIYFVGTDLDPRAGPTYILRQHQITGDEFQSVAFISLVCVKA